MTTVLVSGLINLETTLRIDGFPLDYSPVRYPFFGVNTTVSGVGFNVAKALTVLGDETHFLSLIGRDQPGRLAFQALEECGIHRDYVVDSLEKTAQSVIIYDETGKRAINVDLKDIQERQYPEELFARALLDSDLAVLCNINFSRPFLSLALNANILIATDVHAIADIEDIYNRDFMTCAEILFMSDERLPCSPQEWVRRMRNRYGNEIIVIGLGAQGALLSVNKDHSLEYYPSVTTRPVVNTIGAGDALFSCFMHYYLKTRDPYMAMRKATIFASFKIGASGAADGFLTEIELDSLFSR